MLCPEVWSFDSPGFNATETVEREWNDVTRRKLFNKIDRTQQMTELVTVVLPNCQEEHQEEIQKLIEAKGSSYTVQGLPLTELLNPVFIEGFLKRGKFLGLSIGKDPKAANCIVSISAEGTLHLSVDKEVFQSLRLEGKPVQSSRKVVDKYLCSVNLLDESLLKTTKYRETIHECFASALLPKIALQFKWQPPAEEICESSAAKYFSDKGYVVEERRTAIVANEELSRRLASFSDLKSGDKQEMLEHLGMLVLDCSQAKDEYLNSYEYTGEMVRVKNTLIVRAKGFFKPADVQNILSAIVSTIDKDTPWVALNAQSFTRTPFCEQFFEDFSDASTERALTFVLNSHNESFVHQITPIVKNFSK